MGMDPRKAAAEWLRRTVFQDEAIRPRNGRKAAEKSEKPAQRLPAMLRTARSLENGVYQSWQSRESVFLKQGKLLAAYEDDYSGESSIKVTCYYPTYQALTDPQLRCYFSWRTRLRRGDVREASLSFAFLHIYELINQIGVADPLEGYRSLERFRDVYGRLDGNVLPYLSRWMVDYVVYYGLDPALLDSAPRAVQEKSILVLEQIQTQPLERIMDAVKRLSPKWLARSRFYADHREDMDRVTVQVLRRMSAHYAARCKKTMVEQYFGGLGPTQARLFDAAIFCNPLKRRNYEYVVNEHWAYFCRNGIWSVWQRAHPSNPKDELGAVLKTIDSMMRQALGDRNLIKAEVSTKWILKIIQEEIQALLAEQKAAEEKKIAIDYGQLSRIRRDAALTRDRLIVDEEDNAPVPEAPAAQISFSELSLLSQPPAASGPAEPPSAPAVQPASSLTAQPASSASPQSGETAGLSPQEYRLLQCLLYGGGLDWVRESGCLLSVLVDGINEKLYDAFSDTVLDDTPRLVEDYIDDLKEMVHP